MSKESMSSGDRLRQEGEIMDRVAVVVYDAGQAADFKALSRASVAEEYRLFSTVEEVRCCIWV